MDLQPSSGSASTVSWPVTRKSLWSASGPVMMSPLFLTLASAERASPTVCTVFARMPRMV